MPSYRWGSVKWVCKSWWLMPQTAGSRSSDGCISLVSRWWKPFSVSGQMVWWNASVYFDDKHHCMQAVGLMKCTYKVWWQTPLYMQATGLMKCACKVRWQIPLYMQATGLMKCACKGDDEYHCICKAVGLMKWVRKVRRRRPIYAGRQMSPLNLMTNATV